MRRGFDSLRHHIKDQPLTSGFFFFRHVALAGATVVAWRDEGFFSRGQVYQWRQDHHSGFSHHADDYLQFVPLAGMFLLDGMGVRQCKGYESMKDQLKLLAGSQLVMAALVYPIKEFSNVERPNNRNNKSFPSGHTAQAFLAATMLHRTFGERSVWISVGAYSVAAATGAMRILNNAHWLTDVLAGAAVGILSVQLTHDLYMSRRKQNQIQVSAYPVWNGAPALGMQVRFGGR